MTIGYTIKNSSSNFAFTGDQAKQINPIIRQSTMQQYTIKQQDHCSSTLTTHLQATQKMEGCSGSHQDVTIIKKAEHKNCGRSCKGVLESPKFLTQIVGKGQTDPGENPERPIPIHGKGTDEPKHRDMTDMFMGKKPASSGQETPHKWQLAYFSKHGQK